MNQIFPGARKSREQTSNNWLMFDEGLSVPDHAADVLARLLETPIDFVDRVMHIDNGQ